MDFAFSDEQEQLRQEARGLLAKECPTVRVRQVMESPDAHDETLWKKLVESGWTSLGIPEEHGGFGSMGLGVPALLEAGTDAQKGEALPAIAAGEAKATLAVTEPSGRWDAGGVQLRAAGDGGGWRLDGVKLFVPDAGVADFVVVPARTRGAGED